MDRSWDPLSLVHLGRSEVLGVGMCLQWIDWDPNKAIDIREGSICRGGRLEIFYLNHFMIPYSSALHTYYAYIIYVRVNVL